MTRPRQPKVDGFRYTPRVIATSSASTPAREIGFWTAVSLVVGNMIGSGVFLLPASLARFGGLSLGGWLISTAGATLLALVFARLASLDPASGGPYAFTRRAFGDLAGFLVAWGYWISSWTTNAALAVAFVGYLDPFFPTIVRTPATAAATAIGAVWLLTIVNIAGVRAAGRVQFVTTILKTLPLVVVGVAGVAAFAPAHFAIVQTGGRAIARDLMATTTLTLWAFLGLECATIPAGRVRDPAATIPRATLFGTIAAAVIYIVSTIGVMSLVSPSALAATTAPFADAARAIGGQGAAAFVALGAAISCFGALNGWILVVGQLPLAVAEDGLFPRAFGRLSPRGTPARGMIIAGVLTTALIAMNYAKGLVDLFTFIILLATLSTLVPYVFCALAGFLMQEAPRDRRSRPSGASWSIVASLAFVYSFGAIAGAGADVVYWGFVLLLAGLPVYVWVKRRDGSRVGAV
jgi:APA family basic amino acid/polyamine antiporter